MSYVNAALAHVAAAASDLAGVGATIGSANAAALGPTSSVLPPGADEVSMSIAALFGTHSQVYQQLSAQAALFHQQFVQLMSASANQYAATEDANAMPLQAVGQGALGTGGSAPLTSAAHLATAVSPSSGVPAAQAPTFAPLVAMRASAPVGARPLAPA